MKLSLTNPQSISSCSISSSSSQVEDIKSNSENPQDYILHGYKISIVHFELFFANFTSIGNFYCFKISKYFIKDLYPCKHSYLLSPLSYYLNYARIIYKTIGKKHKKRANKKQLLEKWSPFHA